MGATNFGTIAFGKTAMEAYKNACSEAVSYYGHQEGYNGTISTTNGFVVIDGLPRFDTKAFDKAEDNLLDQMEKWGKCACVELKGKAAKDYRERNGLKGKKGSVFYFFGWAAY